MSIESLTYAELGTRLGASPEAARSLARRLRLTRRPGNDGKVRVTVDLAEIQYKRLPARPPGGHRKEIDSLNARIEQCRPTLRGSKWKSVVLKPAQKVTGRTSSMSAGA
jgi:hypothetical protein